MVLNMVRGVKKANIERPDLSLSRFAFSLEDGFLFVMLLVDCFQHLPRCLSNRFLLAFCNCVVFILETTR